MFILSIMICVTIVLCKVSYRYIYIISFKYKGILGKTSSFPIYIYLKLLSLYIIYHYH